MMREGFLTDNQDLEILALLDQIAELKNRIRDLEIENADLKKIACKPLTWNLPEYYISTGTRKNSNEVYFQGVPGTGYTKALKEMKMRWNPKKKCWFGFVTAEELRHILTDDESGAA